MSIPAGVETVTVRSEEHTSELQSLMRNPYARFCLKKNKNIYVNKSPLDRNSRKTANAQKQCIPRTCTPTNTTSNIKRTFLTSHTYNTSHVTSDNSSTPHTKLLP